MNDIVLLVDDDDHVLSGYRRGLRGQFRIETASGPAAGLKMIISAGPFAVVVSDLRMPGMDGIRFLSRVRERAPETTRIMLTGKADLQAAIDTVNEGHVFRFLTKPCPVESLAKALEAGLEQYRLRRAERELLENTLGGSVTLLTDILSLVNPVAFGCASRLQQLVRLLLPHFDREQAWQVDLTARLSQIGLLTLPVEIVEKAYRGERLAAREAKMFQTHPKIGSDLVANIPRLEPVAAGILHQLKRFDGYGPPKNGRSRRDIPLGGRVLKVVLDYDKLVHSGATNEAAIAELHHRKGWYDPDVLQLLQPAVIEIDSRFAFRLLTIKELTEGMLLRDAICAADGTVLVGKRQEITPSLLARLKNLSQWKKIVEPISVLAPVERAPGGPEKFRR